MITVKEFYHKNLQQSSEFKETLLCKYIEKMLSRDSDFMEFPTADYKVVIESDIGCYDNSRDVDILINVEKPLELFNSVQPIGRIVCRCVGLGVPSEDIFKDEIDADGLSNIEVLRKLIDGRNTHRKLKYTITELSDGFYLFSFKRIHLFWSKEQEVAYKKLDRFFHVVERSLRCAICDEYTTTDYVLHEKRICSSCVKQIGELQEGKG